MNTFRNILCLALLLAVTACTAQPQQAQEALPPAKSDAPQPAKPGTLAASVLAGKWTGDTRGHLPVPIDPSNGQPLPDYEPISLGQSYSYAFSPDRRTLAVVGYVSAQHPNGGSLHLIDLEKWEDHVQELRLDAYVNAMDFSPDGKRLAIAYGNGESQILVINVAEPFAKSKSAAQQAGMEFLVNKMKFTSDGGGLMVYGFKIENRFTANEMSPEPAIVALLDSADLGIRWQTSLEGVRHGVMPKEGQSDKNVDLHQPGQAIYFFPGLAFAPEHDALYVAHPDEDKLTSVDFSTQKISTVEIKPQLSWIERLLSLIAGVAHAKVAEGTSKQAVISPDGQFLYIVGQRSDLLQDKNGEWQMIENPLGLQIVRTQDGSRLASYDTEASDLSISHDGQYLFLLGWSQANNNGWTQIFDTSSSQFIKSLEHNTTLVPTRRINGEPVLASSVFVNGESEHRYAIFDSEDLSVMSEWKSVDYLVWLKTP